MGTAIVSIALSLNGQETLSRILLAIAGAMWLALAVLLPLHAVRDLTRFRTYARTPVVLSAAASTAVLGTRLTLLGWAWAGIAMLALAFVLSAVLLGWVLRDLRSPTAGASLLLAVCPQSLAVLAATLAVPEHAGWLLLAALVPFGLGLALYALVIFHFDFRQLAVGGGDHWITGGAIGISALAAAKIAVGAKRLMVLGGGGVVLKNMAVVLWVVTMLWLPVLLFAEARWPRFQNDPRRWSTVFPLGMYTAASFAIGGLARTGSITGFARVWVWLALAAWALVLLGTIGRARP